MSSAHASPNFDTKFALADASEPLSVALIGPHEERRWAVANALAETHRVSLCEFDSYPPEADHLQRLFGAFDVIMLDVDSDSNLALRLVEEKRTGDGATIMVYSEKADRNLVVRFMRAGAREYLLLPLEQGAMAEALVRATTLRPKLVPAEKPQGKLFVFAGSKGGSGVTTLACNLAIALPQVSDQSTLLIDLALPIGDAALCLGMAADFSTEDALREINRLDAALLEKFLVRHRSGVFVLAAPTKIPEIEVSQEAIAKLIAVARRKFDYVVVDVGSRIDVVGKSLFEVATTIYLVTQTGISELRNSNRVISQFFSDGSQNLEVVINRIEPRALEADNEEGIAKLLGRPVQWEVPDDQDAAQAQYGETGISETLISRIGLEMASSIAGCAVPQRSKSSSDLRGYGRSIAQVNFRENDPPSTTTLAAPGRPAAPVVTWPTPAPITHGEKLTAAQLNATASVEGKFVYTPGPGYVLPTGTHTLWVTFTPAEWWDDPLQVAVTIVVTKATPDLSWPLPPEISRGAALDERYLNASSPVPGKFDYSHALGEVLPAGTHTLSVTFTPADRANYTTAQATRSINVTRETPVIEWPALDPIAYGTQLSARQLCASASIPGRFEYTPGLGAMLAAGEHRLSAVFTPEDASGYTTARIAMALTVTKATPALAWPTPDHMTHGAALGAAQLNASATIPGSFAYAPAAGEILPPGVHKLTVTFTPSDALNYTAARAVVSLSVAQKLPVLVSWPAPPAISYGTELSATQLNATASVPGTFVYTPAAGNVLAPGKYTLSVSFVPEDSEKYSMARAAVELEVKGLPDITSSPAGTTKTSSTRTLTANHSVPAAPPVPPNLTGERSVSETMQRETRTYKGAVYEKGEDGQWHLQKK